MKATPRKLAYADSDKEAPVGSLAKGFFDRFSLESSGTSDTHRQTRSTIKSKKTPSKNKEPTHLRRSRRLEDQSTTKEKAKRERSKSERKWSEHQETSSDSEYEEGGVARNWFDDLDPKSVDSFEELSQKFLEEFSQQKRYAKDPTEIHGIKRRQNKGLQAFMDRFKSESSHIKGIPPVLRISTFMQGSKPSLGEKLPLDQQKLFVLIKETKDTFGWHGLEDLKEPETGAAQGKHEGIWGVYFPEPPPLIETPEKQNMNKFCDYHGDRGHNTNDCYQLKNKIKEAVASQSPGPIILEGEIEENQVQRILVDGGSSSKIMYEHCFRNLDVNIWSRLQRCKALMIGSTRMRSLRAVGSTIHSMIKFLTNQGVVTMETSKEALQECKYLEWVQGSDVTWKNTKQRGHRKSIHRQPGTSGLVRKEGSHVDNQLKEVEGLVIKKFFGQREQVEKIPNANEGGTLNLSKKLHTKSTPTLKAWRLYLCKEAIKEGSGIRIILIEGNHTPSTEQDRRVGNHKLGIPQPGSIDSLEEKMYSYAIRLKFKASNYAMDCEALLVGLDASANQDMKDLHVFIDSSTLVAQIEGNHTPST
nr:reverse transcriptase domain-containing protein [Tanacetum cinerariifolium]